MSLLDSEALAVLHEGINEILDLVAAYRTACLERHFTEPAAEAMTIDYHRMLLAGIKGTE